MRDNLSILFFISAIYLNCLCLVQGVDDDLKKSKPSDFKTKLAKTEFSEGLKISKPVAEIEDFAGYENESISDLGITVPTEHVNDTVIEDYHTYYNSTFYTSQEDAKQFWVDLDDRSKHDMLSNSYRQATTVELSFDFPFYGILLRNITIATGGFLYMGDYLHNWIAATQYVAPLMANFDTSLSSSSFIKYMDNGTSFTAEWYNVIVQDRVNDGGFTFQVTLLNNGDVIFAYKEIPYAVLNISDSQHPVKIGISDAYILERSIFFVRRKTIYEYHRIDMLKSSVTNDTAMYFTALPTCAGFRDCTSCLAADKAMECRWCEAVKRCSDGIDRHRQNWVVYGCTLRDTKKGETCPSRKPAVKPSESDNEDSAHQHSESKASTFIYNIAPVNESEAAALPASNALKHRAQEIKPYIIDEQQQSSSISPGAIITIVVFLMALLSVGVWIAYAYKFPQTSSGQFLIKYRPSQWTLKSANAATSESPYV